MAENKKREAVYVELDCLLDTRYGTLRRLSEEATLQNLEAGYIKRDEDNFIGVAMQDFHDLYAKRDTLTLALSHPTGMLVNLFQLSVILMEQAITRPYHGGGKIVVNTYPYQLTDAEEDTIGRAIAAWMRGFAPVELISVPPHSLTPLHCKQSYAMMIVYDYPAWMNLHAKAFETTIIPEITLIGPALYFGKKPTQAELEREERESTHPMRAMELLASPLVELKLIDAKYFSVLTND